MFEKPKPHSQSSKQAQQQHRADPYKLTIQNSENPRTASRPEQITGTKISAALRNRILVFISRQNPIQTPIMVSDKLACYWSPTWLWFPRSFTENIPIPVVLIAFLVEDLVHPLAERRTEGQLNDISYLGICGLASVHDAAHHLVGRLQELSSIVELDMEPFRQRARKVFTFYVSCKVAAGQPGAMLLQDDTYFPCMRSAA